MYRCFFKFAFAFAALTSLAVAQPMPPRERAEPRDERSVIIGDRNAAIGTPPTNEIDLRRAFAPVTRDTVRSVASLIVKGEQVALATVVSDDGYLVTKASEISFPLAVRLTGGRMTTAELVGIANEHDLALLKVSAKNLTPVVLQSGDDVPVGRWIASVGTSELPLAVGVVSVGRRVIPAEAILGVFLGDSDVEGGEVPGALIMRVDPRGSAAKAGIRGGDIVIKINDRAVVERGDVLTELSRHKPGDSVAVHLARGDERLKVDVQLARRLPPSTRSVRQNTMGSRLNDRRSGFAAVLQHDAVNLQPKDCGSPLVTLDGTVVGINIARAGRTETYAIPSSVVIKLIDELKRGNADGPDSPVASDAVTEDPEKPSAAVGDSQARHEPTTRPNE